MGKINLWEMLEMWKKECKFVELSYEVSPETPHWSGFPAMSVAMPFDYSAGFRVHEFTLVSQYGGSAAMVRMLIHRCILCREQGACMRLRQKK